MISYRAQTVLDFFLHLFGLYLLISGKGLGDDRQDATVSVDTIHPLGVLFGGLWTVGFVEILSS
jgi:hypothetical protein